MQLYLLNRSDMFKCFILWGINQNRSFAGAKYCTTGKQDSPVYSLLGSQGSLNIHHRGVILEGGHEKLFEEDCSNLYKDIYFQNCGFFSTT
jgi:hypothetical protein